MLYRKSLTSYNSDERQDFQLIYIAVEGRDNGLEWHAGARHMYLLESEVPLGEAGGRVATGEKQLLPDRADRSTEM